MLTKLKETFLKFFLMPYDFDILSQKLLVNIREKHFTNLHLPCYIRDAANYSFLTDSLKCAYVIVIISEIHSTSRTEWD